FLKTNIYSFSKKLNKKITFTSSCTTNYYIAYVYALFKHENVIPIILSPGTIVLPQPQTGLSEVIIYSEGDLVKEGEIYRFVPKKFFNVKARNDFYIEYKNDFHDTEAFVNVKENTLIKTLN